MSGEPDGMARMAERPRRGNRNNDERSQNDGGARCGNQRGAGGTWGLT